MARLDRLAAAVKAMAQLEQPWGASFLTSCSRPCPRGTGRQRGLHQLVEAEFLYQRGLAPQATYRFKHALIQDTAYQSLLRSTASSITSVLPRCWKRASPRSARPSPSCWPITILKPDCRQAIPYWQRAGQRASSAQRLQRRWPTSVGAGDPHDTPGHPWACLAGLELQIALGPAVMAIKGWGEPRTWRRPTAGRESCVDRWDNPAALPSVVGTLGMVSDAGGPRDGAGGRGAAPRSGPATPTIGPSSCWPTTCWGITRSGWASLPLPARTWSRGWPSTMPSGTMPWPPLWRIRSWIA